MNTETKQEIIGIVMCHGENDYGYWGGFSLTEEEEEQIYEILMRHDTEGCSIRGTRNDIANEIREQESDQLWKVLKQKNCKHRI